MKHLLRMLSLMTFLLASACNVPTPTQPPLEASPLPQATATQPVSVQATATVPVLDGEQYGQQLAQAVEARDLSAVRALMGDRFAIATWNTGLNVIDADEALDQLAQAQFAPGAQPAVVWGTDTVALLDGHDPLAQWGPVDNVVRAMHVMGLGPQANEESLLVIGRRDDGSFYWHGIMIAPDGYFHPIPANVLPTDVQFVLAKQDLKLRAEASAESAEVGDFFAGQMAKVSGKSIDEAWWWVRCDGVPAGFCWLPADLNLTEPTQGP